MRIAETAGDKGLMTVRTRAPFLPIGRDGRERPTFTDPVVLVRAPYRVDVLLCGPGSRLAQPGSGAASCRRRSACNCAMRRTDRTLSVSTATLVHADMPADCVLAEVIADCRPTVRRSSPAQQPARTGAADR